jgi:hypothetical protein
MMATTQTMTCASGVGSVGHMIFSNVMERMKFSENIEFHYEWLKNRSINRLNANGKTGWD